MRSFLKQRFTVILGILLPIAALAAVIVWRHFGPETEETAKAANAQNAQHEKLNAISLTPKVIKLSGIEIAKVTQPTRLRKLELRGSLAFDPNRLHAVNSRFPGQITEIATVDEPNLRGPSAPDSASAKRQLSYTDRVTKGQRMAVVWSKDLGEKKSELVDAQARLMLDQVTLSRLKELVEEGSVAERSVRDAEKNVSLDVIAVRKAELTLSSWRVSDQEIERVKAEAEVIHQLGRAEKRNDSDWARVDVVAPIDGTVVEKNITMGDIVDTNDELFKVADLSVLTVYLHAYEEDLMYLRQMGLPIRAEVHVPANPDLGVLEAKIDRIGDTIDPNEHMALLIGSVKNAGGTLQAGQFVSATIPIWNEPNIVEVPATALVDEGSDSYVFVQTDPDVLKFECRKVRVVRRQRDVVYLRSHLNDEERDQGVKELHADELVVARGALELREDLLQQQAANAPDASLLNGAKR
ncbi:MAG TPA: efflux RND transporter periplasmic adaptor subunit [Pirellulales bacterium]|nr:efflux RND transporter periplasmic adaptor subunit [Pirellulales bacterium]